MYEKLVKSLRNCVADENGCCFRCPEDCNGPCQENLMTEAADAIEELATKLATLQDSCKWTSVTERLPKGADKSGELCENVWLFFDDGNVYPGWMNGITETVYYLDNYSGSLMTAQKSRVKMWQPRPEPPKEET